MVKEISTTEEKKNPASHWEIGETSMYWKLRLMVIPFYLKEELEDLD